MSDEIPVDDLIKLINTMHDAIADTTMGLYDSLPVFGESPEDRNHAIVMALLREAALLSLGTFQRLKLKSFSEYSDGLAAIFKDELAGAKQGIALPKKDPAHG